MSAGRAHVTCLCTNRNSSWKREKKRQSSGVAFGGAAVATLHNEQHVSSSWCHWNGWLLLLLLINKLLCGRMVAIELHIYAITNRVRCGRSHMSLYAFSGHSSKFRWFNFISDEKFIHKSTQHSWIESCAEEQRLAGPLNNKRKLWWRESNKSQWRLLCLHVQFFIGSLQLLVYYYNNKIYLGYLLLSYN